jgi:hypothetical protein
MHELLLSLKTKALRDEPPAVENPDARTSGFEKRHLKTKAAADSVV